MLIVIGWILICVMIAGLWCMGSGLLEGKPVWLLVGAALFSVAAWFMAIH